MTPREENELNKPREFEFRFSYGMMLQIFIVALIYCVNAPLIVPFAAIYFSLAYLVFKYQVLYVYVTPVESGGSWFPLIVTYLCFGIFLWQLTTFGVITALITSKTVSTLLAVLPFATIAVWLYFNRWMGVKAAFINKKAAQELGSSNSLNATSASRVEEGVFVEDHFLCPAVSKKLWKVCVREKAQPYLHEFYHHEYKDMGDWIRKNHVAPPKLLVRVGTVRKESLTSSSSNNNNEEEEVDDDNINDGYDRTVMDPHVSDYTKETGQMEIENGKGAGLEKEKRENSQDHSYYTQRTTHPFLIPSESYIPLMNIPMESPQESTQEVLNSDNSSPTPFRPRPRQQRPLPAIPISQHNNNNRNPLPSHATYNNNNGHRTMHSNSPKNDNDERVPLQEWNSESNEKRFTLSDYQ